MMKAYLLTVLTLAMMLLSACSFSPVKDDPLDGTSWQLASLAGKPALPGAQVTLTFLDGQAGGSAGCNSYGGAYEVDGQRIAFHEIVSTLMACADPARMDQESAFLASLNGAQRFALANGRLQLTGSGGEALTFVPAP